MAAVRQTVAYRQPSALDGGRLALQTAGGVPSVDGAPAEHPFLVAGTLTAPRASAVALAVLADLCGTDFRRAGPSGGPARDPIVTSGGDRLRAETLTACGGLYARLDLLPGALYGVLRAPGSTTVDVSPALCDALSRVGAGDPLHLEVGPDGPDMPGAAVEKNVPVPERWLRALAGAAPTGAALDLRAELDATAAAALLHRLPAHHGRDVRWLLPAGRSVRMTTAPAAGAVCLPGAYRLAVLRPLLPMLRALRLYGPPAGAGSPPLAAGWELDLGPVRFAVLLSPGVERGLSTEEIPDPAGRAAVDAATAAPMLGWDGTIDPAGLGLDAGRAGAALAVLAAAGRVGYDWSEAAWFRRELPYRGLRVDVPAAATDVPAAATPGTP